MSEWYEFRRVQSWPGEPTVNRRAARFDTPIGKTFALLKRECELLRAKHVVLQGYFRESDLRIDGMLRSNARTPEKPGIILSFDSPNGPMMFPCDTFLGWEDNIRAIALSLEALRSVDRYGVTRRAEQYRGWLSLPPVVLEPPENVMARHSGLTPTEVLRDVQAAYWAAAMKTHPDRGGSSDAFSEVQQALWKLTRKPGEAAA
jgi:hypothetical protein